MNKQKHTTARRNSDDDIQKLTEGIQELERRRSSGSHEAPSVGRARMVLDGMSAHVDVGSA